MKKLGVIVGIIVIFLIVGVFVISQKSAPDTSSLPKNEKGQEAANGSSNGKENVDLRYVAYSKTAFDKAADTRRVLFFYANWCPICRPADADFKVNQSKIPDDVTVIRVNYNDTETDQEEKDLAKKYGITYQHTFVQIDSAGNQVTKWNGGQADELLTNIQ